MSSVITLRRVLPEFYEYGTGTLIWRLLYVCMCVCVCMYVCTVYPRSEAAATNCFTLQIKEATIRGRLLNEGRVVTIITIN